MSHVLGGRFAAVLAASALGFGWVGPAYANGIITFVWVSTSGSGLGVGTDSLTDLSVGDTAVLEIRVTADAGGVSAVGISPNFDSLVLAALSAETCPVGGTGNDVDGSCGTSLGPSGAAGVLDVLGSPTIDNTAGSVSTFAAATVANPSQVSHTFALGRLDFEALASGFASVDPYFVPGLDGLTDDTYTYYAMPTSSGATVQVIPEPAAGPMLGLGLAVLAAWRHRGRGCG
jgi:hypothetical protein